MPSFRYASGIDASPEAVFAWHGRPGAFERLLPPWERIVVERRDEPVLREDARMTMRTRLVPGVWARWVARHEQVVAPEQGRDGQFVDVQEDGPFRRWRHVHRFIGEAGGRCTVDDEVCWDPPGGDAVRWMAEAVLQPRLRRIFRFRHRRLADDLARHQQGAGRPPLTVAITGSTGLVGSALVPFLRAGGHHVRPMVRRKTSGEGPDRPIHWSVDEGTVDLQGMEGVDAVVHLAGAPIAGMRWTEAYKAELMRSRVEGTRVLCEHLAGMAEPPRVLLCSSAVGYYGERGDEVLEEDASAGDTYLARVCQAWEAATAPAQDAGIRVVHLRTGILLAANGGALQPMLPAFRAGMGGPIGAGTQYMPCLALDDMVGIVFHALLDEGLQGPVNATAPVPVRQAELARTLGRVLERPAFVPTPAAALRMTMGRQMADEVVLASQRAVPARLMARGFQWRHPDLEDALRFELGLEA